MYPRWADIANCVTNLLPELAFSKPMFRRGQCRFSKTNQRSGIAVQPDGDDSTDALHLAKRTGRSNVRSINSNGDFGDFFKGGFAHQDFFEAVVFHQAHVVLDGGGEDLGGVGS